MKWRHAVGYWGVGPTRQPNEHACARGTVQCRGQPVKARQHHGEDDPHSLAPHVSGEYQRPEAVERAPLFRAAARVGGMEWAVQW
jgi:hypothetical protein